MADQYFKGLLRLLTQKPVVSIEQRLKKKGATGVNEQAIPRRGEVSPCPFSFAQQRLWFLERFEPHSPLYNIPKAVRMQGVLDVEALQRVLDAIVARHEVLRTTFAIVDGSPVQVIGEPRSVELTVVDLRAWPEVEREAEMQRLLTRGAQRPFNLSADLMLRATLLRLDEEEHVLLLAMHHIASDGWSIGVLFRELTVLYRAFASGVPSPLPGLPIQYADYALWQRRGLRGEVLASQLVYWKQQLDGAPVVFELPTDRPRPALQTFQGAKQSWLVSLRLTEALTALSRQEGVTLFMTLLAAFQALLHRYTSQTDIVLGSPIACRTRRETEGLLGFFVNTLVLRTDLGGNPSFRELLRRVREVVVGACAHQDLPFEKLVEELQPERNLSHSSLFQVMFAFQNVPRLPLELPGLTLSPLEVDSGTAKFDLTLDLEQEANGLRGSVEYNTDLFDPSTIARMQGHFQALLEGIVANPAQRLAELPLLTDAERHQLLVEWNDTQADYPMDVCIHQLFEAQAEPTPDAVAVVFEGKQLTYSELNARANQLARYLGKRGIGPDQLVGICVERSLEMVIGLLGILKADGAYLPLESSYPIERLAFMLEDAQASVLLTQARLLEGLPGHRAELICLDSDWEKIAREGTENLSSGTTPESLAYVTYTSGSTGRPKGVMISHRAVLNRLFWMQETYQLTETDRVLRNAPFSTGTATWQFFWPLSVGARSVVARPDGHRDSAYLVELMAKQKITIAHFVPSMLQVLLEEQAFEVCNHLRYVLCDGEALSVKLRDRFFARSDAELYNLYGQTETCMDVTFWACRRDVDLPIVPIGRPYTNSQIYILDSHLQPVPIGVPGELYAGGLGLARGYLDHPGLTTEKFMPNPFTSEPGVRLYKTGDLARYRPDGTIEFLGRLDHQVKIRGFRIELGEIEAVLGRHPGLREVVVLAREDVPGEKRLVAYVAPHHQPMPALAELRRFVKERLPEYMVPAAFVFLEALPLTPNGKVDRRALPAPDSARPELEEAFAPPRTALEQFLAKIWRETLAVENMGIHDDFFELGGDSIKGVIFINRLQEALHEVIYIAALFDAPTIAKFAAYLERHYQDTVSKLFSAEAFHSIEPGKDIACPSEIEKVAEYEELARALAEIEGLSEEEARRLITDEAP